MNFPNIFYHVRVFFLAVTVFVCSCIPLLASSLSTELINSHLASVVVEPTTGTTLYEDRAHEPVIPASLVKMMVSLIVMENLQEGRIQLTDEVVVSRWASKIGGHQVYLKEGEVFQLNELMKAVAIGSANDASVAVAEYIAGSQDAFVDLMNQRAQALQMKNTKYYNPHGLPPGKGQEENVTTAYDQALLARELVKYPKYLEWSATKQDMFRNGTFQLLNTNHHLLRAFPGMDGLKTGYYRKAGFSVVSTAQRNGIRLIAVVIGARKTSIRTRITTRLLTAGFREYGHIHVLEKGAKLGGPVVVQNSYVENLNLLAAEDVKLFMKYADEERIRKQFQISSSITAPVKVGDILGHVELYLDDKVLKRVDLISAEDVEARTLWKTFLKKLNLD